MHTVYVHVCVTARCSPGGDALGTVRFVCERHLLREAGSCSLSSVISATLIIRPRAASTLIEPKTLMEDNEPHSFPRCLADMEQGLGNRRVTAPDNLSIQKKKKTEKKDVKRRMWILGVVFHPYKLLLYDDSGYERLT